MHTKVLRPAHTRGHVAGRCSGEKLSRSVCTALDACCRDSTQAGTHNARGHVAAVAATVFLV